MKSGFRFRLVSLWTAIVAVCFVSGLLGGLNIYREHMAASESATKPLSVLTLKGLFSDSLKRKLAERLRRRIDFREVSTIENLWDALEVSNASGSSSRYDVVTLFSYQMPLAVQLEKLRPPNRSALNNFKLISPDFTDLPGDPSLRQFIPVLWGVTGIASREPLENLTYDKLLERKGEIGFPDSTIELLRAGQLSAGPGLGSGPGAGLKDKLGKKLPPSTGLAAIFKPWLAKAQFSDSPLNVRSLLNNKSPPSVLLVSKGEMTSSAFGNGIWHFQLPADGATLWILGFGVGRETKNETGALEFIDLMLSGETSRSLALANHQASTNRGLEAMADVDPALKASYLRKLNFDDLVLFTDFSRAREVRELMKSEHPRP